MAQTIGIKHESAQTCYRLVLKETQEAQKLLESFCNKNNIFSKTWKGEASFNFAETSLEIEEDFTLMVRELGDIGNLISLTNEEFLQKDTDIAVGLEKGSK